MIPRAYINGRKNLINRCLNNVTDNALKYGNKVEIKLNKKNTNIFITVDDDGPGIPNKERDNVFKPFYKIDKGRADSKSSVGLGLSIASDIIRSHGGNIMLEKSKMNIQRFKIVLLGNSSVGKTSLLLRYVKKKYGNIFSSTIGCSFMAKIVEKNNIKLCPISKHDVEKIRIWRNQQILNLRQKKKITKEDQKKYFKKIIFKEYENIKPKNLIFSIKENSKLIGYGGLVHISWSNFRAEVSLLFKTDLEKNKKIKFFYFKIFLNFNRLFKPI